MPLMDFGKTPPSRAEEPRSALADLAGLTHPASPSASGTGMKMTGIEDLQAAGRKLQGCVRSSRSANPSASIAEYDKTLAAYSSTLRRLTRFIRAADSIPDPSPDRDIQIGQALLPFAVRSFGPRKEQLSENERYLFNLFSKTHTEAGTSKVQITFPKWVMGLQGHLVFQPITEQLPGCAAYLEHSQALQSDFRALRDRIAEKRDKAAGLEELDRKNKKGNSPYATAIAGLNREIETLEKVDMPQLFERLGDVSPENVPAAMNALAGSFSVTPELLSRVIESAKEISRLLVTAFTFDPKQPDISHALMIPHLTETGRLGNDSFTFRADDLQVVRENPALLAQTVEAYLEVRRFLRSILPSCQPFAKLEDLEEGIRDALKPPFSHFKEGDRTMDLLLRCKDERVKGAVLRLLNDPVAAISAGQWGHYLEETRNIHALQWTVHNYLRSSYSDDENPCLKVLKSAPQLAAHMVPFLTEAKARARKEEVGQLARLFSNEIKKLTGTPDFFPSLAPLVVISELIRNRDLRSRLRSQVPNITDLKNIAKVIMPDSGRIGAEVADLVHNTVKALSVSLVDFYSDDQMIEVWNAIEKFKVFMRRPECLHGIPGNEGMKSGIFVAGEPGVGKTLLASCIENELNTKSFTLAPEKKDTTGGKPMLAAAQRIIEAVKQHAQEVGPCLLRIDEAEQVMKNRDLPTTSSEEAELTYYLLQEINELRVKHPGVFIIALTNYPEKVDPGMFRQGRFDVQVLMERPGPTVRGMIIRNTMIEAKMDLALTDEQLEELVQITDDLMPVVIKRTINELSRLIPLVAEDRGEDFHLTYDLLKKSFLHEAELNRHPLAERMKEAIAARQSRTAARQETEPRLLSRLYSFQADSVPSLQAEVG